MPFGYVYVAVNTNNQKRYVGITTLSIKKRWNKHLSDSRKPNPKSIFHRALKKYGESAFIFEIIEECSCQDSLNAAEIAWISRLNSTSPSGYNMTTGGGGVSGFKMTPEFCKAVGDRVRGTRVSQEQKDRQSALMKGRKASDETKLKLSAARRGRAHSPETKMKISASNLGKVIRPESIAAMKASRSEFRQPQSAKDAISRPVVAGGVEYRSISIAAESLGIAVATIARRIDRGVDGWRSIVPVRTRAKRNAEQRKEMRERTSKPVIAEGVLYPSMTEAAAALNMTRPGIAYRIKVGTPGYGVAN